jgi:hypothetical protein
MESTVLIVGNSDVGVLVAVSAMEHCAVVVDVIVEHFYIKKNESKSLRSPNSSEQRRSKAICCNDTYQKFS